MIFGDNFPKYMEFKINRNMMFFFFQIRGKLLGVLSVANAFLNSAFNITIENVIVNFLI